MTHIFSLDQGWPTDADPTAPKYPGSSAMTHHKDCAITKCREVCGNYETRGGVCACAQRCTCPVEPYTAHMAEGMAQAIDAGLPVNSPALAATLRAYAAQGKRIEELEAALGEAVGLLNACDPVFGMAIGARQADKPLAREVYTKVCAFLAKQASK